MADSDGNPPDSSDPRPTPPAQAKPVAPAPRNNPPNVNAGKEKQPAAGGPPGFTDFLEWMRLQAGGEPTADQRPVIPKERKKFQRQDTEAKADKPAAPVAPLSPAARATQKVPTEKAPPAADGAAADVSPEIRPPSDALDTAADPLLPRVRRGQQAATTRSSWINIVMQAAALVLIVASFFLGRASVSKVATAPAAAPAAPEVTTKDGKTTTNVLSSANAALIDQAMAAIQDSRFKEAGEALEKVKASGERVHGLSFQLAQLAVFAGENTRAVPLLNEAINSGEDLGEAYNLRGTLGARRGIFRNNNNMDDYDTATKLEPFQARAFYFWGAALRRVGKSQAAIMRLQQALDRLKEPTAEGLYRLSIRLTQIEVGQEKVFADELARQLALPYPSMDWLFTSAALALRDGKFDAAAAFLDRAEQCGDPDGFSMRLRDFYFEQFNTRKELSRFFAKLEAPKPGRDTAPPPANSPAPTESAIPAVGLDVPTLPPPASPGATVAR